MARDEEAGQGQEQEGGGRAGQPPRVLEVGERLVAVHLEHERPAGGQDPAHRGQHRHAAVVDRLADRLAPLGGRPGERAQGAERAPRHLGVGSNGLAQRREIGGRLAVEVHEERLTATRRLRVVGEERVEPGLGPGREGDHAQQRAGVGVEAGGRAVGEDGHRDHEQPAGTVAAELEARLPAFRHAGGVLRGPLQQPGGEPGVRGGAGRRAAGGVRDHDAHVAVGGGDPAQVPRQRLLVPALAGEQRAHRREGGEHFRVGAPGREPARHEAGPVGRDGGDAALPVGEDGFALGADLVRGEQHDQDGAGQEHADVDPGDALAGPRPARGG